MAAQEEVKIELGQSVDISLESMMGSTGYGWELASLEGSVALVRTAVYPAASSPGAAVAQVFTFRGSSEGAGKAVFVLTASWKVEEPKSRISYSFTVAKAETADADAALRLEGFAASPRATVRSAGQPTPMPPYAFPVRFYYGVLPPQAIYSAPVDPCVCATGSEDCCSQPKYGVLPPQAIYSAPIDPCVCTTGSEDCCNPPTVLKYNFPIMRYNFPTMRYNFPLMRYNFPTMRYNFPSNDGCC